MKIESLEIILLYVCILSKKNIETTKLICTNKSILLTPLNIPLLSSSMKKCDLFNLIQNEDIKL